MTIEDIITEVRKATGTDEQAPFPRSRKRKITMTKKLIYYFACYCTPDSLKEIGKTVANENHDLVLHGKKKIEDWLIYPDVKFTVNNIKYGLKDKGFILPEFNDKTYLGIRYNNLSKNFFKSKREKHDIHIRQCAKLEEQQGLDREVLHR